MDRDSREEIGQDIVSDEEQFSQDWVEYQEDAQMNDKNDAFRQHCHYCSEYN